MAIHDVRLPGCRPLPLASYLKGLAVLRLVSEQVDAEARGSFVHDVFVLNSTLDEDSLVSFFLDEYRPSPVIAPWNGGSGFFPKDNTTAIQAIEGTDGRRFEPYRRVIHASREVLQFCEIDEKPDKPEKEELLVRCRNWLPDSGLAWLDAALVLTEDGAKFPPLLGTGGNDGRLDFTNNFMQRLLDVIDVETCKPTVASGRRLRSALFGDPYSGGTKAAIGQFLPGDAGGANASTGFTDDSNVNPWDFVLMIEGALVFATAAVRRMEAERAGALAYPFTVRPTSAGYGSAARAEDSRGEIWLPVWSKPARAAEVQSLFAEGRARVGRRPVRDGVDFARAVATLGVDRGIDSFQRYGFHVRNGRSYLATPLSRLDVHRKVAASLVDEIDSWFESFRRRSDLPRSIARAVRETERAILDACRTDDSLRVQALLVAVGRLQRALVESFTFTVEKWIRPAPLLSPAWMLRAADGSTEFRLAASLALAGGNYGDRYLPVRRQVEPVALRKQNGRLGTRWIRDPGRDVVPAMGDAITWLNAILARRILLASKKATPSEGRPTWSDRSRLSSRLPDIAEFVEGSTDDRRMLDLFRGFLLLDRRRLSPDVLPRSPSRSTPRPDGFYALLKLCFAGSPVRDVGVPLVSAVHVRAAAGDGEGAAVAAVRRLRGSGLAPRIGPPHREGDGVRRVAASLLFPLGSWEIDELADLVLEDGNGENSAETATDGGEGGL